MHTTACMVFFCLTPALSDLLTARATEPRVDRALVEKLIVQLGHTSFARRDAAEKALQELGIGVLPLLVEARSQGDPEIRRRLDELIPPMQAAALLAPRRITLPARKSAKEYAGLIGAQSNYVIHADGLDARQRLDLACTRSPFWETLDRLCDATGFGFTQNANEDSIRLVAQNADSPFRCYDGIFRVTATGFNYSRSTHFAQLPRRMAANLNQSSETLMLSFVVHVEPKTPMLRAGRVKVSLAEDEEGHSMVPQNDVHGALMEGGFYSGGFNRSHMMGASTGLVLPGKSSRMVKRIKGIIPVTLLAEQKPLLVTGSLMQAKGKKFKAGDATFQIDDVETTGGNIKQYGFKITYNENTNETRYDYSKIQSLQQRLELRDAKGVKISSYPNFLQFNSATSAQMVLKTQGNSNKDAPLPTQLYYISWVQLDHDVAFDLKDLPLP